MTPSAAAAAAARPCGSSRLPACGVMPRAVRAAIATAPDAPSPRDAALARMAATAAFFNEIRDHARRRAAIVAANPSLQERELLKLAAMAEATATALRQRGTGEPTATLAAH